MISISSNMSKTQSSELSSQRSFTIPMTEETIVELIKTLESKLTASAFAKEQRTLMTSKLRDFIKARDNYEEYPDVIELAKLYNDSGIDKIMILHKRKSGTLNLNPEFRIPDFFFNFPKANLLH